MNLKALAVRLKQEVDAAVVLHDPAEHRNHLGASLIGRECDFYLWATYRWLKLEHHIARMKRLFNRGHLEEARFIQWLTQAGWTVQALGEDGEQQRVSAASGHFGGSLDSRIWPPQAWPLKGPLLGEFKTHKASSYAKLTKEGVKKSKPEHYVQMCVYGVGYGITLALYCAVNKDDDDLYFEFVELDHNVGLEAIKRGEYIIGQQLPPKKVSNTPTDYRCKTCHFAGICHFAETPEKNCRSCTFAKPIDNGQWSCQKWGTIPKEAIALGCDHWERIT